MVCPRNTSQSAIKRNEALIRDTMCVDLANITLRKGSQKSPAKAKLQRQNTDLRAWVREQGLPANRHKCKLFGVMKSLPN